MSYSTFAPGPKADPPACRQRISVIAISLYVLFSIAFHTSSLILAFQFDNAKCFDSKEFMSLTQWLMVSSFPNIIGWFVMICAFACFGKGIIDHNGESVWAGVCTILMMICVTVIYYIIVIIFGIIELGAQYGACMGPVGVIDIFVIAGIINNIIVVGLCAWCAIKLNPKCSISRS